jgi:hypothetical protein
LDAKPVSQPTAKIERQDLNTSDWQGCDSSLCEIAKQIDPGCATSYCSRAKTYSGECTSSSCLTKKIAFEKDVRDRLSVQNELRRNQAINANATPVAPGTQSQD